MWYGTRYLDIVIISSLAGKKLLKTNLATCLNSGREAHLPCCKTGMTTVKMKAVLILQILMFE